MTGYARPHTLEAALACLSEGTHTVLAGGTDFYPAIAGRHFDRPVLDASAINGLRGITRTDTSWRIGGLTTWTDVVQTKLPPAFDGLKAAAREVGSIQIQNVATVAGNLCNASPAADGVPPLLTLDARVELSSADGARTLPLGDFITGNRRTVRRADELLTAILVPATADNAASAFLKLGAREYLVISIVSVAALLAVDDGGRVAEAHVAVGACSEVPCRLPALEASLLGMAATPETEITVTDEHLAPLSPIDDIRASASYRLEAAKDLIVRALERCSGGST